MFELLIIVLLTLLNGVLSMSELAIVSSRKALLQQRLNEGDKRAGIAIELGENPNRFLSTVQIGITLIGILAGAFGGATLAHRIALIVAQVAFLAPYAESIGFGIVVAITTYLSLVIGELVPKRLALQDPERIAVLVAPWMLRLSRLTAPLVRLLSFSTEIILRLLGVPTGGKSPVSEAEIQAMIDEGVSAGVFDEAEQDMVSGIFSLDDLRAEALMTPRTEIVWLDLDDPAADNIDKIIKCPHSRFPVGKGSLDNVVGIVRAKDMLNTILHGGQVDLAVMAVPPLYVPESKPPSAVLDLFKQTGKHLALVVGEHGGIEGLVTINDIIREIVGDIEAPQVVQRQDGSWLLDGLLPVDEFKTLFDLDELPDEDSTRYQTLGGFVMTHLGRIPVTSDRFEFGGLVIEVMDMDGKRVDKVLVSPLKSRSADTEIFTV